MAGRPAVRRRRGPGAPGRSARRRRVIIEDCADVDQASQGLPASSWRRGYTNAALPQADRSHAAGRRCTGAGRQRRRSAVPAKPWPLGRAAVRAPASKVLAAHALFCRPRLDPRPAGAGRWFREAASQQGALGWRPGCSCGPARARHATQVRPARACAHPQWGDVERAPAKRQTGGRMRRRLPTADASRYS
jgi:hypothetical protein